MVTNAMSDGMVRKWVRVFNEGRQNLHDEARSGRPSLVNADLMRKVNEKVRDDTHFTISDLSLHFPRILFYLQHNFCNIIFKTNITLLLTSVYSLTQPLRMKNSNFVPVTRVKTTP